MSVFRILTVAFGVTAGLVIALVALLMVASYKRAKARCRWEEQ